MTIINSNALFAVGMITLLSMSVFGSYTLPQTRREKSPLVLRIDDVQDFAYRDAQLLLYEYSIKNHIPMSLATIPEALGSDALLLNALKSAVKTGSEITAHGWEHEDLTALTEQEQEIALQKAKQKLEELLGVKVIVLVPPLFKYNQDTVNAMQTVGYSVVSGLSETDKLEYLANKIISVPATVEVSDYENGTWAMKSFSQIMEETHRSFLSNGYAVVVTHPQELIRDGAVDPERVGTFCRLLQNLQAESYFTTLQMLAILFQS